MRDMKSHLVFGLCCLVAASCGINQDVTVADGNLVTTNGSISLRDGSRIAQDIEIRGKAGSLGGKELEITIADGSVVEGDIDVRDDRRKVTVILSGGGRVEGKVRNAEVVEKTP